MCNICNRRRSWGSEVRRTLAMGNLEVESVTCSRWRGWVCERRRRRAGAFGRALDPCQDLQPSILDPYKDVHP